MVSLNAVAAVAGFDKLSHRSHRGQRNYCRKALLNILSFDIFKKEMCEKFKKDYLNDTFLLSAPCSLRPALCALCPAPCDTLSTTFRILGKR
jgi:hypothetical protein